MDAEERLRRRPGVCQSAKVHPGTLARFHRPLAIQAQDSPARCARGPRWLARVRVRVSPNPDPGPNPTPNPDPNKARALLTLLVAPLSEEVFFRAWLLNAFERSGGAASQGLIVSAGLYGLYVVPLSSVRAGFKQSGMHPRRPQPPSAPGCPGSSWPPPSAHACRRAAQQPQKAPT